MNVLITGASGQVGRAVQLQALPGVAVTPLAHADLDITNGSAVHETIDKHCPQWIVNAAAYTAVDLAESAATAAHALNATAVGHLARAAQRASARLIQLSTDFVFDGNSSLPYAPDAKTGPLSVYGASKLAGEQRAVADNPQAIVLRTSWVYATGGRNFVHTMLGLMAARPEVSVVCDQVGAPTWAMSLARAVWRIIEIGPPAGIYHWCDAGVASWYDFAVAIQEEAVLRGILPREIPIVPIRSAQYPTPARRPAYSVLDTAGTRALIGLPASHWRTQLRRMLDELAAR
jgi:dTDP-4-dehydrorhamnose reductase